VAGKHVTVFDYPDGRFEIALKVDYFAITQFDRLSRSVRANIVSNKRLGSVWLSLRRSSSRTQSGAAPVFQGDLTLPTLRSLNPDTLVATRQNCLVQSISNE